jgi:hypothetical protein
LTGNEEEVEEENSFLSPIVITTITKSKKKKEKNKKGFEIIESRENMQIHVKKRDVISAYSFLLYNETVSNSN